MEEKQPEKISDQLSEEFLQFVQDLFNFEVDTEKITFRGKVILELDGFWKDLYVEREHEEVIFNAFNNSNTNLLFLTGHVGTGKSTFLRHTLYRSKIFHGVIIRMEAESMRFDSSDDLAETLRSCILDAHKKNIIRYLKKIIFNREYPYVSVIPLETWEGPTLTNKALKELAVLGLAYINDDRDVTQFKSGINIVAASDEIYLEELRNKLNSEIMINDVLNLFKWYHYIKLYRIIMRNYDSHIIVFDNMDWLNFEKVKENFIDNVLDVLNFINNNPSMIGVPGLNVSKIKFTLAVRDENIAQFRIESGAATQSFQITLGKYDFTIRDIANHRRMTVDIDFAFNVISKRIDKLEEFIEKYGGARDKTAFMAFKNIITTFWIDTEKRMIREDISHINIRALCNDSLRLILNILSDSAIDSIKFYHANRIDYSEIVNQHPSIIKGRIIMSFWHHVSTRVLMLKLGQSIKKELSAVHCCIYRLILTYLINIQGQQINVQQIIDEFTALFDVDEGYIKECLFSLYNSEFKQGELITIYQYRRINSPGDIDGEGEIKIKEKGIVFLDNIMINLDFFGRVVQEIPTIVPGIDNRCLLEKGIYEFAPDLAHCYLSNIFKLVRKTAQSHQSCWANQVVPKICKEDDDIPFVKYKTKFCYKNLFHIERVCDSHINIIQNYLRFALYGPNNKLFLNADDNAELLKEVPEDYFNAFLEAHQNGESSVQMKQEVVLEKIITDRFKGSSNIYKIWEIYLSYKDIVNTFSRLKKKTLSEIKEGGSGEG